MPDADLQFLEPTPLEPAPSLPRGELDRLLCDWVSSDEFRKLRPKTFADYSSVVAIWLIPVIGHLDPWPEAFADETLQGVMSKRGLSDKSIRHAQYVLAKAIAWLDR